MKKTLSFLLVFCMLFTVTPFCAHAESYKGSDFTTSTALASKLDSIFSGNCSLYYDSKCESPVNAALGSQAVNGDHCLYVGLHNDNAINIGYTCWIYANAVYFTLFGECTGNGDAEKNSVKLDLSGTDTKKVSYDNFTYWGVRNGVGALIRSTTKDFQHSYIVLKYDSMSLTILDGNGDGNGKIQIQTISWDQVPNLYNFQGDVLYIIQPSDEYYYKTYPSYLSNCSSFFSLGTLDITSRTYMKTLPCSRKTCSDSDDIIVCNPDDELVVTGLYINTAGNYWYQVSYDGKTGYIYSGDAMFSTLKVGLQSAQSYYSITGKDLWQNCPDGSTLLIHS